MHQFKQEDIKVLRFAEGEQQAASEVAVVVAREGRRPHLILCEIAENQGFHAGKNIIPACMAARDTFAPGLSLADISWQYMNGRYGSSTFDFKMAGDWPLFISCEHNWPFTDDETKTSLNVYADIVNERLASTFIGPEASKTSVIVPVDAPNGYISLEWEEPDPEAYRYAKLYLVDSARFGDAWLSQIEEYDRQLYKRFDKAAAQEHLIDSYANRAPFHYPLHMAEISYWPDSREIFGFTNGNHRTLNLIAAGAPFIPMQVSAIDAETHADFAQKFGWQQKPENIPAAKIGCAEFKLY